MDCHESKDLTEELLIAKIKVWPDEKLRKKINAIAKKIDKETAKTGIMINVEEVNVLFCYSCHCFTASPICNLCGAATGDIDR